MADDELIQKIEGPFNSSSVVFLRIVVAVQGQLIVPDVQMAHRPWRNQYFCL